MVATGPRPPMTMGNNDGDEPLKINIGEGMMGTFLALLALRNHSSPSDLTFSVGLHANSTQYRDWEAIFIVWLSPPQIR